MTTDFRTVWIAFGDIHDAAARVNDIPELAEAQGVLVTGDLTVLGGKKQASDILGAIQAKNRHILAQFGNMDLPDVNEWLSTNGCNLHRRVHEIMPGVAVLGMGGSTPTPFQTPGEFPDSTYAAWLDQAWKEAARFPQLILVSHTPPLDTACDRIHSGAHVGSRAVRTFLEEHAPALCLCGHIHESAGVDFVGKTQVINPGPLENGGYVVLTLSQDRVQAELKNTRH